LRRDDESDNNKSKKNSKQKHNRQKIGDKKGAYAKTR
jgi:hypothetical protein